jgi:glycosyltransferase involved in cell wall biosynthesis
MQLSFGTQRVVDQLPWRIARRIRRLFPPTYGHCSVISTDPAIIVIPEDFYDDPALWRPFFEALAEKKVYFLCLILAGIEGYTKYFKDTLARVLSEHQAGYPRHQFIFLANNAAQEQIFAEIGVSSVFVNHNTLVDEKLFTIRENIVKKYDALYNAVMLPYKRHLLASYVRNLALITYFKPGHDEYVAETAVALKHAAWLNFKTQPSSPDGYSPIPKVEVPQYLNEARVGLCLSEIEGAMFASIEYLLCGLPIVSTPSIGGRDVFFDSDYVLIVDATPEAVQQGVAQMLERRVPADHIRQKTVRKIAEHRARLIDLVTQIYSREGKQIEPQDVHRRLFANPIYQVRELHRVAAAL